MIRLSEAHLIAIRGHGAGAFPRECCGVLIGDVEAGVKIVREVRALPNTFEPDEEFERSVAGAAVSETPVGQERRYMVSPDAMFELMREERRTKRKALGRSRRPHVSCVGWPSPSHPETRAPGRPSNAPCSIAATSRRSTLSP